MEREHLEHEFARKPAPQSVRLIDFDRAEVQPGIPFWDLHPDRLRHQAVRDDAGAS